MANGDHLRHADRARFTDARLPLAVLSGVLALGAGGLYAVDSASRDALRDRLATRTESGAEYIRAQTVDIMEREEALAGEYLSGAEVTFSQFERASDALALDAAVLLDERGRLVHVLPRDRTMIGTDMTEYPHLAAAVRTGNPAVSPVVQSATLGVPVVAFAVAFPAARGQRVFSGGLDVQQSALGQYLQTAVPLPGAESYLVDGNGRIVASSSDERLAATFAVARPSFSGALEQGERSSEFEDDTYVMSASAVPGTTWTLVLATPHSVAFAPAPSRAWLLAGWLLLALLGTAAAAAMTLSRMRHRQWSTTNARLRSTFDNPLVGMVLTAPDGGLIAVNETFCALVGRPAADLSGRSFEEVAHPEDRAVFADRAKGMLAGEMSNARFDARCVRSDGQVVHAALTSNLVRDPTGQPDYFTTQVVDVTPQRAAEAARAANLQELVQRTSELEVANADLGHAHRQVSDLMSMVSHDVRQPLMAVVGFSEWVLEDWPDMSEEERLELVGRIARAGKTAEQLLQDSLTTTALQGGGVVPHPTTVPVVAAVRGLVEQLLVDRPDVTVTGSPDVAAHVDQSHLMQVLANLLTNALKYGKPPIVVACASRGDDIIVCVNDEGPGIPAEFVPEMFERYTRSDSARGGPQQGTGLGLHIARTLVEANGGTIAYRAPSNGVGGGFEVTLRAASLSTSR